MYSSAITRGITVVCMHDLGQDRGGGRHWQSIRTAGSDAVVTGAVQPNIAAGLLKIRGTQGSTSFLLYLLQSNTTNKIQRPSNISFFNPFWLCRWKCPLSIAVVKLLTFFSITHITGVEFAFSGTATSRLDVLVRDWAIAPSAELTLNYKGQSHTWLNTKTLPKCFLTFPAKVCDTRIQNG